MLIKGSWDKRRQPDAFNPFDEGSYLGNCMTVLCGVIPPRLLKSGEWATEDDWLIYELAQKQKRGVQVQNDTNLAFLIRNIQL